MNIVEFKGYQGSVEYEDGKLYLQILHIDDTVITECDHASEVEGKFQQLVDGYLSDCESLGRNPNPPFKGSFNVRVGEALHKSIAYAAARNKQSLNGWVSMTLAEAVRDDAGLSDLIRQYHTIIGLAQGPHISEMSPTNVWVGNSSEGRVTVRHGGSWHLQKSQLQRDDVIRMVGASIDYQYTHLMRKN